MDPPDAPSSPIPEGVRLFFELLPPGVDDMVLKEYEKVEDVKGDEDNLKMERLIDGETAKMIADTPGILYLHQFERDEKADEWMRKNRKYEGYALRSMGVDQKKRKINLVKKIIKKKGR